MTFSELLKLTALWSNKISDYLLNFRNVFDLAVLKLHRLHKITIISYIILIDRAKWLIGKSHTYILNKQLNCYTLFISVGTKKLLPTKKLQNDRNFNFCANGSRNFMFSICF